MVDWLYEELDPTQKVQFDEHVQACTRCHDELQAFTRTRDTLRVLPEEDPPPALSAILLHEAARRAPAVPTRAEHESSVIASTWKRLTGLFQPIVAHPAVAAIATLVLAVGVAGTFILRGEGLNAKSEVAETSRAPAPELSAAAATPGATPRGGETNAEFDGYRVEALNEQEKQNYGIYADTPEPELKPLEDPESDPRAADTGAEIATGRGDSSKRASRSTTARKPLANAVTSADVLDESEMATALAAEGEARLRAKAQPTEPVARADGKVTGVAKNRASPRPPPAPTADKSARGRASGVARSDEDDADRPARSKSKSGGKTRDWAKVKEGELQRAIRAKNCRRAAQIAADIFERDRGYYYERIHDSAAFKTCRSYIEREQQQRSRRRAKTKAQSSPAPEFDDEMAGDAE